MAKSSKPTHDAISLKTSATAPAAGEQSGGSPALSKKVASKKSTTATRKQTPPNGPLPAPVATRKTSATAKPKKTPARKKTKPAEFIISDEDVRLRAYFIAQHRTLSGLSGDSASDWLEARRQLFEEAVRRA